MTRKQKKYETDYCLDEIEAAQEALYNSDSNQKDLNKWVRHHKELLKEVGYTGSMPKQKKRTKKRIVKNK